MSERRIVLVGTPRGKRHSVLGSDQDELVIIGEVEQEDPETHTFISVQTRHHCNSVTRRRSTPQTRPPLVASVPDSLWNRTSAPDCRPAEFARRTDRLLARGVIILERPRRLLAIGTDSSTNSEIDEDGIRLVLEPQFISRRFVTLES